MKSTMKLLVVLALVAATASNFQLQTVDNRAGAVDWSKIRPAYELYPQFEKVRARFSQAARGSGGRIVGGQVAAPYQFPYQVGLFIDTANGQIFCGGSIISPVWVLTAAHCADPGTRFEVIAGALNIREDEPTQVRVVTTEKIVNSGWNSITLANDIALLKLPEALPFSDSIQSINLPSSSELGNTFVGVDATASGWGKDSDSSYTTSDVLRFVKMPVISNLVCILSYIGAIKETNICTSGLGGRSTCSGDSGGPLVIVEANGSKTQVGIVSFGLSLGCQIGWPPVFTRVTSFADWISTTTGIPIRT